MMRYARLRAVQPGQAGQMCYASPSGEIMPVCDIEFPMGVTGARVYHDAWRMEHVPGEGLTFVNERFHDFWQGLPDPVTFDAVTDDPGTVTTIKLLISHIPEYMQWQDDGGYAV